MSEISPVRYVSEMPTAFDGNLLKIKGRLTNALEKIGSTIAESIQHIKASLGGDVSTKMLTDVNASFVSSRSTPVSKTDYVGTRQLQVAKTYTAAPQIAFTNEGSINIIREAPAVRNAFFQGGGVKGMAYAPFLRVLNDEIGLLQSLREVAGTSAGACVAFLVASGLSPDELEDYLKNVDLLKELGGSSVEGLNLGRQGIFSGNQMVSTFTKLAAGPAAKYCQFIINNDPSKFDEIRNDERFDGFLERANNHFSEGMTFNDLKLLNQLDPEQFKLLNVTAFDSDKKEAVYFNAHDTPDVFCHHAVRASMAIPHFFKPVQIDGRNLQDGGVATNAPLEIFSKRADFKVEETVGFVFEKSGSAHKILHDPKTENLSLRDSFIRGVNKIRVVLGMGPIENENQSPELIRDKVSPFRAFVLGKGYIEARVNDAEKINELGFNAFVVPHGKLGTFSFGASAEKVKKATRQAIAAAQKYAEWRKNMAFYKTYDSVEAAIASMSNEEKLALIKSTKEEVERYLKQHPQEGGEQIEKLNDILKMDNPDLSTIFGALKFMQGRNRMSS